MKEQMVIAARLGDLSEAYHKLTSAPDSNLSVDNLNLKRKYIARFQEGLGDQHSEPLIDHIKRTFQTYWRAVLLKTPSASTARLNLFEGLRTLVSDIGKFSEAEEERLFESLRLQLLKLGYFSMWGNVLPHADFMLWRRQEEKTYLVDLGDLKVDVPVVVLDDFKCLGWLGFASFNETFTGGWATKEKLFCVWPSYQSENERFRVSYLGHEARHFSDFKRFPDLQQADLEYRAKLTELCLAEQTQGALLEKFARGAVKDPLNPHALASYNVTENLKRKSHIGVREAARELLQEDDARLERG